jgi:hypothetical protein
MKKTIALISCALLCLTCICSYGQGWEKSYGGPKDDIAYDVIKTSDGGYVAVGSTLSFGAGGTDVFIVKINSSGKVKWTQVIGGPGNDVAYSVQSTSSDELIVAGVTGSYGAGGNDAYLIKLTANGTVKWTKTFGNAGNDEARAVIVSGSNFYIAGSTTLPATSNSNFYLFKTDAYGNLLWQKNYGTAGSEMAYGMTKTSGGGFALAGYTSGYGNNKVYLVKVNSAGDTLFTGNYYEGTQSDGAKGIAELPDHGLVMSGTNYSGVSYSHAFLLKVSSAGSTVYNTVSTALSNDGTGVAAMADGGVIQTGTYCNFGCRLYQTRYYASGVQEWSKYPYQYGNNNSYNTFSTGYAIKAIGPGSHILSGSTYLPGGTSADFLIIKTDTAGNSGAGVTISANGPTTFCSPGSVVLSAPAGYISYQWTYTTPAHGFTYIAGANASTYTASAIGYYSCIMKSADNDVRVGYSYINIISTTPPVISTSGPASFCAAAGESLTLSVSSSAGFGFQWKLNGSNIAGATGISYAPAASGNYTVQATNTCGVFNSAPLAVNVLSPPAAPVVSSSGFLEAIYCNGIFQTFYGYLSVPQQIGVTYQWYHNGAIINGATNSTVVPDYNNENYTCKISNACGNATSAPYLSSYYIFTSQDPALMESGPVSGCGVTSVTLSTQSFQDPYEWYLNGNIIPGAITESYTATASGSYVCAFNNYDCGYMQSLPTQVTISANPVASIAASGPTAVCSGSVTLNASPTGAGNTYTWYKDNGAVATTASYAAIASGTYKCRVTQPSCGMTESNLIYVSIGVPVNTTITISAPVICSGSSASLAVQAPATGQTYQWKRNGSNIGGATASSYAATLAGTYICNITNSCGTVPSNSVSLTVNQSPAPAITGDTLVCPASVSGLTENSGSGNSWQWYSGNNTIGGATSSSYAAPSAGSYKVRVTATNSCTAFSNVIVVKAGSLPVASVVSSGYPAICKNDPLILKTGSGSGYSYQWKKNGIAIPGETDSVYSVIDSGTYSVTVSNICGTATSAFAMPVSLKSIPVATITPQGPTTFCLGGSVVLNANAGSGYTYSWKKNGTAINGATLPSYTATTAGTYKVTVTNNNGCSKASAGTVVSVPCKSGDPYLPANGILAAIYPNPYNESFTLLIDGAEEGNFNVVVRDVTGKEVQVMHNVSAGTEIQTGEHLEAGYYFVDITAGYRRMTLKVVKN